MQRSSLDFNFRKDDLIKQAYFDKIGVYFA